MKRIFINGFNAKAGGGRSILTNYLSLLKQSESTDQYSVLVPDITLYQGFDSDNIRVFDLNRYLRSHITLPVVNKFFLPYLIRKLKSELIFNLSDIAIPSSIPQIFLFDWPYAVYPESVVWKRLDFKSYLTRKIKLSYFKELSNIPVLTLAQSVTMKNRLEKLYGLKNIDIVPNAVSLDNKNDESDSEKDFGFPDRTILLYLTHYYPHKNIEVFIPLAKRIRELGLEFSIVTTIESNQHPAASKFLNEVRENNLEDFIINIGAVEMRDVPALYRQSDALLMPTLLESFSGTYVEAMYHGLPIFTSDIDFAKDVCRDSAYYFDPLNHESILSTIMSAFHSNEEMEKRTLRGEELLSTMPNWQETFDMLQTIISDQYSINYSQ